MSEQESTITDVETLISELDGGVLAQKIGRALSDVAAGTVLTGKVGKVSITFDMKQIGESSQIEMANKISYTKPTDKGKSSEENTTKTPLYVGRGGKLSIFPDEQGQFDFMNNRNQ